MVTPDAMSEGSPRMMIIIFLVFIETIITLHTCARGKATGSVIVFVVFLLLSQNPRSRHLGVLASDQCYHNVKSDEKQLSFRFKALDNGHKHHMLSLLFGHAYSLQVLVIVMYRLWNLMEGA